MMSDDTAPSPETDMDAGSEPVAEATPEASIAEALAAGQAALDALMAENAELKDRVLRTIAEMENLRKRTEREVADTRTYAIAGFARDMLTATDSLNRALLVLPAGARENADANTQSLIDGIELTEREMTRLLAKHGVKPIEALGQKFDPHKHQAMFEVPGTDQPEGSVVQVMQTGYAIGDRVLRPAMVGIAKGAPRTAEPAVSGDEGVDKTA